jgi:hypothetical protein
MTHLLANIALAYAAAICFVFVITYHVLADWKASAIGRNIMALMTVAAILLTISVLRAFVPWFTQHIDHTRLVGFVSIGYIVTRRLYLLLREQRIIRRKREETRP